MGSGAKAAQELDPADQVPGGRDGRAWGPEHLFPAMVLFCSTKLAIVKSLMLPACSAMSDSTTPGLVSLTGSSAMICKAYQKGLPFPSPGGGSSLTQGSNPRFFQSSDWQADALQLSYQVFSRHHNQGFFPSPSETVTCLALTGHYIFPDRTEAERGRELALLS